MRGFFFAALLTISGLANSDVKLETFHHSDCGFFFQHPNDWEVVEEGKNCEVIIRPKGFEDLVSVEKIDYYTILLDASKATGSALRYFNEQGLSYINGNFVGQGTVVRHQHLKSFSIKYWSGFKNKVHAGCYYVDGGRLGAGCPILVITAAGNGEANHFGFTIHANTLSWKIANTILSSFVFDEMKNLDMEVDIWGYDESEP